MQNTIDGTGPHSQARRPQASAALSRRSFLQVAAQSAISAAGLAQFSSPALAQAGAMSFLAEQPQTSSRPAIPKWPQRNEVRQVWLKRQGTSEALVARYYDGQQVSRESYIACCTLLRDIQSGSVVHMDLGLLDLVYSMQKWLVEWGIDRPLIVHSGYRSPATNAREGGVRNSMHLQGRAIDFSIEGIASEYMGRLATIFGVGGVGFYVGRTGFTHIDTGSVRYWSQRK